MVSMRLRGMFRRDVAAEFCLSQSRVNVLVNDYVRSKTGMNLTQFRDANPGVTDL